jgi:hypothetical protein
MHWPGRNEELTFWKIWSNFGTETVYNVTGDTPINDFEEETVTAIRNLPALRREPAGSI